MAKHRAESTGLVHIYDSQREHLINVVMKTDTIYVSGDNSRRGKARQIVNAILDELGVEPEHHIHMVDGTPLANADGNIIGFYRQEGKTTHVSFMPPPHKGVEFASPGVVAPPEHYRFMPHVHTTIKEIEGYNYEQPDTTDE